MDRIIARRVLQAPYGFRNMRSLSIRYPTSLTTTRPSSSLPTIAQASFWKSMIPKPFRRKEYTVDWGVPKKPMSKEWNPATFYIVVFLFIGSMSIQMIALKKDFSTFMRRSETRIGLLREVVEKLQRGEEVDVEKVLGTGDAEKEQEWEEVLKEIEHDDFLRNSRKGDKNRNSASPREDSKVEPKAAAELSKDKAATGYSSFF